MSVFLTGATGFIGGHLLSRLDPARVGVVHCLVRGDRPAAAISRRDGVETVVGSLHEPDSYRTALRGCRTVVHLAARTGKGSLAEHRWTNAEGTRRLLESCRDEGVSRFLHVSTIAVVFPDKRSYPYARSKEEAEGMVRACGLDWAIVRPTIVLGPRSPLWAKFRAVAGAPVMPLFGGGTNRINPVHVDDVIAAILALLERESFGGYTVGVGGRDVLTMKDFLLRLRRAVVGRDGPVVPIPVGPIIGVLSGLERFMMPLLPVGAGQFYAFRHDGVPDAGEGVGPPIAARRGVDEMIRELSTDG